MKKLPALLSAVLLSVFTTGAMASSQSAACTALSGDGPEPARAAAVDAVSRQPSAEGMQCLRRAWRSERGSAAMKQQLRNALVQTEVALGFGSSIEAHHDAYATIEVVSEGQPLSAADRALVRGRIAEQLMAENTAIAPADIDLWKFAETTRERNLRPVRIVVTVKEDQASALTRHQLQLQVYSFVPAGDLPIAVLRSEMKVNAEQNGAVDASGRFALLSAASDRAASRMPTMLASL